MNFEVMKLSKALKQYPILYTFNLTDGGSDNSSYGSSMKGMLKWNKKRLRYITAVIVLENDKPIGWSWLIHKKPYYGIGPHKRYLKCWFYIDGKHRRKGVGTKLFAKTKEITKKRHRPMTVDPWDPKSRKFFSANGMEN